MSIHLKNVNLSFAKSGKILQDVTLDVADGEFVVLLGASGSGKSCLLRIIAGLETDFTGTFSISDRTKENLSFVFQEAHLMPWRSVSENVKLPLELNRFPASVNKDHRVAEVLKNVGLESAGHLYPRELSGGMKMRASLARAIVTNPELLLMDEPFAALDEATRFKLSEDLLHLWRKLKMTIVFVTHSLSEACFLAERVVELRGKPASIGADLKIQLPRIRESNLRLQSEFATEMNRVYKQLVTSKGML